MAQDDIYKSKKKYEFIVGHLEDYALPPKERLVADRRLYHGKYWCKNKANLAYFRQLFDLFEAEDQSFIRRIRLVRTMRLICHVTRKDLKDCDRPDVNQIVAFTRKVYSPRTQSDFVIDLKFLWKKLLPEIDERGRVDDTLVPYPVRHVSGRIDRSKQKTRQDKLKPVEFEKLMAYFSEDSMIQAYLALAFESLGRPQEIFYRRIRDLEVHDDYAKIWISDHGKEGVGFLQCIDSFPALMKWYNEHPFKRDKDAFFFIRRDKAKFGQQMTPAAMNKRLRLACERLKLGKRITCYSLKRNGVTFRRLRGDTDMQIQHAARWTSTKQLSTYDMSDQDDALKAELIKRGLVDSKEEKYKNLQKVRLCTFCNIKHGMAQDVCSNCKRPLDRTKMLNKDKEISQLRKNMTDMQNKFEVLLGQLKQDAAEIIEEKLEVET